MSQALMNLNRDSYSYSPGNTLMNLQATATKPVVIHRIIDGLCVNFILNENLSKYYVTHSNGPCSSTEYNYLDITYHNMEGTVDGTADVYQISPYSNKKFEEPNWNDFAATIKTEY